MSQQQIPLFSGVSVSDDAATAGTLVKRDASGDTYNRIGHHSRGVRSGGHLYITPITKSTTASIDDTIGTLLLDGTSAGFTATLPAAAGCTGQVLLAVKVDATANAIVLDGNGAETIGGRANITFTTRNSAALIISDGTGWQILAEQRLAVNVPLMLCRSNTGLVFDATGGAGLFAITATPGTSLKLTGETANTNTKTDYALFEITLPEWFNGGNLTVTVNAEHDGAGTAGTKTVDVEAWLMSTAGACGADICATAAQNFDATATDYTFTITGTTLTPGARVLVRVTVALQETGGTNLNAVINSIRLS